VLERIRKRLAGELGFAGLEMLIVVAVLGVVLGVAVPSYLGLRGGTADADTKASLRAAMPAADAYFQDHKTFAGLDSTDLLRIDPRVSVTVAVTAVSKRSYCLTESVNGKTWSVRGPNPKLVAHTSLTKGWFEGDRCR
jgi:type II secretory pathway pseudopilin PulG